MCIELRQADNGGLTMNKKSMDNLLNTLGFIAMYKSWLPFNLRGWVNVLGLHVQERRAGRWTRLQAGGSLHSYLDVWQEDDGEWQVRKFDEETWERRFAHIVEPTCEIADFLSQRVHWFGELDADGTAIFNQTIQQYKDTGIWPGLPKVPEDVINKRLAEDAREKAKEEHNKRVRLISDNEKRIRSDPLDRLAWSSLADLCYQEQRYKDMENALKMSLKADVAKLGRQYSITYTQLGKMYLSAFSVCLRGKGIPILGYLPTNVKAETLGYDTEQLRELAQENLTKAYELDKNAGFKAENLKELELALKAARVASIEVFEEFDKYKEKQRQLDEERQEKSLKELFDKRKDDNGQEDL
jgi:hypothetical protein